MDCALTLLGDVEENGNENRGRAKDRFGCGVATLRVSMMRMESFSDRMVSVEVTVEEANGLRARMAGMASVGGRDYD
jgi:hypothetical protein